jgi:pimeloyl-ACP methyl ester carboxylesterase
MRPHTNTLKRRLAVTLILGFFLSAIAAVADDSKFIWPGEKVDDWMGGKRHTFEFQGHTAWVTVPAKPRAGNPWVWCTEFPTAFTERTGVPDLIKAGFYHVHLDDFNGFGNPKQLELMDAFYDELCARGLNKKATLIGLSRGGFMAYRWAERNPGKIACIYGDAPVCDMRSWPGGKPNGGPRFTGDGSPGDWAHFKEVYSFKTDDEARAFTGNVLEIEALRPLAKAGVPILHVVGEADKGVPPSENSVILVDRYKSLGGKAKLISEPGKGHHPHGLDNPKPIIDFITTNVPR